MKIGIIGIGNVGSVLGKRLAALGHQITYGVKDPSAEKATRLVAGTTAKAATVREAIDASQAILLAVPWEAAGQITALIKDQPGKIIIDCTNPLLYNTGFKEMAVANTTSAAEEIALWAGSTPVVKAFNTTGSANMENPDLNGQKVTMYIAGDDAAAKAAVSKLAEELGFAPFDTGALYTSRFLESLASLWVHTAYVLGKGPGFALNIVSR